VYELSLRILVLLAVKHFFFLQFLGTFQQLF
jgi:hypothetical protein